MKRMTLADLETLAFGKRAEIEVDREQNIAVLTLGQRQFYAQLPPVKTEADR